MVPTFDQMTPTERVLYVQDLWDRIGERSQDLPITEAQRADQLDGVARTELSSPTREVLDGLVAFIRAGVQAGDEILIEGQ